MSDLIHVKPDSATQKFYGVNRQKQEQEAQKQQQQMKEPSTATGLQWAQTQTAQQAGQAALQANPQAKPAEAKTATAQTNIELAAPSIEDAAMLSSQVSVNKESVEAPRQNMVTRFLADRINMDALESSYKEYFKKSKSHNLLLERFMANVRFSAVKSMMTMLGVSSEEQVKMQAEVRDEALGEIDSKIKNDWAYTKAMMDITSG